jgi:hypothetical protein
VPAPARAAGGAAALVVLSLVGLAWSARGPLARRVAMARLSSASSAARLRALETLLPPGIPGDLRPRYVLNDYRFRADGRRLTLVIYDVGGAYERGCSADLVAAAAVFDERGVLVSAGLETEQNNRAPHDDVIERRVGRDPAPVERTWFERLFR